MRARPLTPRQVQVLGVLARNDPRWCSTSEIAQAIGMAAQRSRVYDTLQGLARGGVVDRQDVAEPYGAVTAVLWRISAQI